MTSKDTALPVARATHEPSPDGLGHSVGVANAELAAVWRCGVSTGVEVADRVLTMMAKSRSPAVRRFHDILDEELQRVMDSRHGFPLTSYADAFDAHKRINVAAAKAMEARQGRDGEAGSVHDSAVPQGFAHPTGSIKGGDRG